jgi:predicted DNA-binding protein
MHVPGRQSPRHMKGRQVATTLYLPPQKYWLLKWLSRRKGVSMQALLREAVDEVLEEAHRYR